MNNKPVHTIRYGAVKLAIWCNQTANGPMHNVTLSRSYKDGDEWKDSSSFGTDDLLAIAKALVEAHSWVFAERLRRTQESGPAEDQNGEDQGS